MPLKSILYFLLLIFVCGCNSSGGTADFAPEGGLISGGPGDSAVPMPSSGCGGASATAGTYVRTLSVGGVSREYRLIIPAGYSSSTQYKLIFGWHGYSNTAMAFQNGTLVTPLLAAANGQAIFVLPQGIETLSLPVGASGKNDMLPGWDWRPTGRDVLLFDAIYESVANELCVDLAQVYSFGRSMGGYMSNILGCARGHILRAMADEAGAMPDTMRRYICSSETIPVWKNHNQDDTEVGYNFRGAPTFWRWINENSCTETSTAVGGRPECYRYSNCDQGGEVVFCNAPTGGHATPSFAGSEIWNFFNTH